MKSRVFERDPYTMAVNSIGAASTSASSSGGPNANCSAAMTAKDHAALSGARRRIRHGTISSIDHTMRGRGPSSSPNSGFHGNAVLPRDIHRNTNGAITSKASIDHVMSRAMMGNTMRHESGNGRENLGRRAVLCMAEGGVAPVCWVWSMSPPCFVSSRTTIRRRRMTCHRSVV